MMTSNRRAGIIISLFFLCLIPFLFTGPIAQDEIYHQFADTQTRLGLPNMANVVSNLPFFIFGIWGLVLTLRNRTRPEVFSYPTEFWNWTATFFGIALVAPGSAYYHLAPNNASLVWDRLPMTIAFMGLFAAMISERVKVKWGVKLLPVLTGIGAVSVFYWSFTEQAGMGDLRPYALVQFFPLVAVPVMLTWFPSPYEGRRYIVCLIVFYFIAKGLEFYDVNLFALTGGIISGHSLKHLSAGMGCYFLVRYLKERTTQASH